MPNPKNILFSFFCCLLLLLGSVQAQNGQYQKEVLDLPLTALTVDDGLSQGLVFMMAEDDNGYLWVATKDGLNRYDGNKIKTFYHNYADSLSLSDSYVEALFVDSKSRLWVGTQSGGLNLYNPANESFLRFPEIKEADNSIRSNRVAKIGEDALGRVWAGFEFSGRKGILVEKPQGDGYAVDNFEFKSIEEIYPAVAKIFTEGNPPIFWGTTNYGNVIFMKKDSIYDFNIDALLGKKPPSVYYTNDDLSESIEFVLSLKDCSDGNIDLYLLENKKEIKKLNKTRAKFETVFTLDKGEIYRMMLVDRYQRVWAIMEDETTLIRIDLKNKKLSYMSVNWGNVDPAVNSLEGYWVQDANDNFWIGKAGYGLLKISAQTELFKKSPKDEIHITGSCYISRAVTSSSKALYDKKLKDLWLETRKKLKAAYPNIGMFGFEGSMVYHQGAFWAEAHPDNNESINQLRKIDPYRNTFELLEEKAGHNAFLFPQPIFFDKEGGLWTCSGERETPNRPGTKQKYWLWHRDTMGTWSVDTFPVLFSYGSYRAVSDWYVAENGVLWLATTNGVLSYNPFNKEWKRFCNIENDSTSLSYNITFCIWLDPREPERFLWIGTEGSGLNKMDITTGKCQRFTTANGLPNNVVYAVMSDKHSNLWISTNKGLCLFNTQDYTTRNFTVDDGLAGNEFNRYQYSADEQGNFYFGGVNGVTYFNPEDFYQEKKPSKVVINQLSLLNKPITYSRGKTTSTNGEFVLPAPIEQCKQLVFNYDDRMISLGFSLLDLTNPNRNQFKYILEGFNTDWIDAGTDNQATYTNLNPGNYTFKVIGSSDGISWSREPTEILITILPPWWGTWWFRALVILAVALALYGFYRYRLGQLLKMERMRNRIAQDLHDEVGSTLSSISLYSAAMQKTSTDLPPKTTAILDKIIDSTSEVMEKMNDMVWTIKTDNDSFGNVVNRMRAFAVKMSEARGIQLHFEASEQAAQLKLDMYKRKNIYLIFKEAVNNAMKYSKGQNLYVKIGVANKQLYLEVRDDGIGFDPDNLPQNNLGGNGLKGIRLRAEEVKANLRIISSKEDGTGVILSMAI